MIHKKICITCGRLFKTKYKDNKNCSQACSEIYRKKRSRENALKYYHEVRRKKIKAHERYISSLNIDQLIKHIRRIK